MLDADAAPLGDADLLEVVRRFEPVLRFTEGELFFPMSVHTYVEQAALWVDSGRGVDLRRVVDHGDLDMDRLCAVARAAADTDRLQLRFVPGPLSRRELRHWRRDATRPRFRAVTRFAAVGLLGRLIDLLFRVGLLLRGTVPGGLVAASHRTYRACGAERSHPYYAQVRTDGGYLVVQYWFFYAMNDWRSTFAGINDHEADWEQVTVFLVPADGASASEEPPPSPVPDGDAVPGRSADWQVAWIAFSSHDEAGADLRRRVDDPDITWVGGTHPVVHAGAGSHSGAYLAGEYLVRVEPPALRRATEALTRIRNAVLPWRRDAPAAGVGIPFIDYKRGDGPAIGWGTDRAWTPVLVDAGTTWIRDFRGLWGLDTDDPFGGERAPAGPRYERSGAIRESWADPVGWAALDAVPPTAAVRARLAGELLAELGSRLDALAGEIDQEQSRLRRLAAGPEDVAPAGRQPRPGGALADERDRQRADLARLRALRRSLTVERERLRASLERPVPVPPHAHLRRRALPDADPERVPGRLVRFWSEASLSVLLALLGVALLGGWGSVVPVTLVVVAVVVVVEVVLRQRLAGLAVVAVVAAGLLLLALLVLNPRQGLGALAVAAAVLLAVANLRSLVLRR